MIENIKKINERLKLKDEQLSCSEIQTFLEDTYAILSKKQLSDTEYSTCLEAICRIANSSLILNSLNREILKECIYKSRVFLYEDTLNKKQKDFFQKTTNNITFDLQKAFYTLDSQTVLTRDQKLLFDNFHKKKRVVVSAPTSFGKTRIIEEIIRSNDFNNILIVVPTLALSNEIYFKLKNLTTDKSYNLAKTIKGYNAEKKNILVYTPEKSIMLIDEYPELKIDFFVMDEIYKINHEDDRRKIFLSSIYEFLIKRKVSYFYLIGPYFKEFSKTFLQRTDSIFLHYENEIVKKDIHDNEKAKTPKTILNRAIKIINEDEEQAVLYTGSKQGIEGKIKKIVEDIKDNNFCDEIFINHLEEEISSEWQLPKALKKGVAFHHADMPNYVKNEIISSYNDRKIKVIICTNTITEGVNTSAKKVVFLDSKKGKADLSAFDVKNIKGRAGRSLEHFVGDVYVLTKDLVEASELESIEFPYLEDVELNDDEVIQIDNKDLADQNKSKKEKIENKLKASDIDFLEIKKNRYIDYEKQINLIKHLRANPDKLKKSSFEGNMPNGDKIDIIFELCENYLFSDYDKNRNVPFRNKQLLILLKFYISNHYSSPKDLLEHNFIKNASNRIDTRVRYAFKFIHNYCEFRLPKYFHAFQNIWNYVNKDDSISCNLELFLLKLEFGTTDPLSIELREAGLPLSLTKKITSSNITNIQNLKPNHFSDTNPFEQRLLKKLL